MTDEELKQQGRVAAVNTYIQQTQLLVALSSAFLLAPAGLIALLKDVAGFKLHGWQISGFVTAELCLVASVLAGYVVLGTIAGYQAKAKYDVNRTATRISSLIQIGLYLVGMILFVALALAMVQATPANAPPTKIQIVR